MAIPILELSAKRFSAFRSQWRLPDQLWDAIDCAGTDVDVDETTYFGPATGGAEIVPRHRRHASTGPNQAGAPATLPARPSVEGSAWTPGAPTVRALAPFELGPDADRSCQRRQVEQAALHCQKTRSPRGRSILGLRGFPTMADGSFAGRLSAEKDARGALRSPALVRGGLPWDHDHPLRLNLQSRKDGLYEHTPSRRYPFLMPAISV